jgi:tubulin---tyrosine ligase
MRIYYSKRGRNVFDFLPLTFHVSKGLNDSEWKNFQKCYHDIEATKAQN